MPVPRAITEHVRCGDVDAKGCRLLQHVYESARARGFDKRRSAMQAWGALKNAGWRRRGGIWVAPTGARFRRESEQARLNEAIRRTK